jgi:hypothetical protein
VVTRESEIYKNQHGIKNKNTQEEKKNIISEQEINNKK